MGKFLTTSAAEQAPILPSPPAFQKLRVTLRHCWADAANPVYRLQTGSTMPRSARAWIEPISRGVRTVLLAATIAGTAALWIYFRALSHSTHAVISHWITGGFILPFLLSLFLPIVGMRRAFARFRESGRLEALLITRLSNGELTRGLAVPEIRRAAPLVLIPAIALMVWPFAFENYDITKRFLLLTFYFSLATNVVAMTWISMGLLVSGSGLRGLTVIGAGFFALDPFMLTWLAGLLNMGPSWRPLIFAFGMLELLYISIRIVWAYLVIRDLDENFRLALTR